MNDRQNRFSVVFGSTNALVAGILYGAVALLTVISSIISLIQAQDSYLHYAGSGMTSGISFLFSLIGVTPLVLIFVGFLLSYLSGKKYEISPAGLMCIKVPLLIKGIISFIGMLVLSTVSLFIGGAVIVALIEGFELIGGVAVVVIVLIIFTVTVLVAMTVFGLMYTIKMFNLLGKIRWYEQRTSEIKTKFLKFFTILSIVSQVLQIVLKIMGLVAKAVIGELANLMSMQLSGDEELAFDFIFGNYLSPASNLSSIFSIIMSIAFVAFGVMVYILLSKVANIVKTAENVKRMEQQKKDTLAQQNNAYEIKEDDSFSNETTVRLEDVLPEPEIENTETTFVMKPEIRTGSIISLSGQDRKYQYPIQEGEELIIGKDPKEAHIIVSSDAKTVSRKHCGIKFDAANNQYLVIDYSTNGTYINSIRRLNKGIYVKMPRGTIINLGKENIDFKLD